MVPRRVCQQDLDAHGIDPRNLGSRIDCFDSHRFTLRTLDKNWAAFEAKPDLALFPVSMALDQHLTTTISPSGGGFCRVWAPLDTSPEIAVFSDFPTLHDLFDDVRDGEDLANQYDEALSEVVWINSAGANMFIVTSTWSPRR